MDVFEVIITKQAERMLKKLPVSIVFKLQIWIGGVKTHGLREMRKVSGFHDEPLKGTRQGQRSIRLNKAYRAIYIIDDSGITHIVEY